MRNRDSILLISFFVCSLSLSLFANELKPVPFTYQSAKSKEVLFRLAPQFGILGKLNSTVLNAAIKRFVIAAPEGSLDFQITEHWFLVASFNYAYLRGKVFSSYVGRGHVLAPTAGFRIVSSTADPTTGDFFDDTRWWFALEFGPYFTKLDTRLPGNRNDRSVGFNTSAGFDYLFAKHWGIGLQMKLHYAKYSLDDYFLYAFGPHFITRF